MNLPRAIALVCALTACSVSPVAAAGDDDRTPPPADTRIALADPARAWTPAPRADFVTSVKAPATLWRSAGLQGSALGTFAALQALDTWTTFRAISTGAREANPIMAWASDKPAAFAAVKGAMTASTMILLHRYAQHHPKGAVLMAIALDAGYATVVAMNAQHIGPR